MECVQVYLTHFAIYSSLITSTYGCTSTLSLFKPWSSAHYPRAQLNRQELLVTNMSPSDYSLKAMSLGAGNNDIQISLGVLDECIQALQSTAIDSMHLSSRYGTLMERHVARFRRNFVGPFRPNGQPQMATAQGSQLHSIVQSSIPSVAEGRGLEWDNTSGQQQQDNDLNDMQTFGSINIDTGINFLDDWMAQPFDPSIAPFGTDGKQVMSGFHVGSLDFLWNLPT
jgi:hypothetical protein